MATSAPVSSLPMAPRPPLAHVWLGGPEATGKSVLAHWISREAQVRGLRAVMSDGMSPSSPLALSAAGHPGGCIVVTEWHDPGMMSRQLASPLQGELPLLVLLCADDLPTPQPRCQGLAQWRDAACGGPQALADASHARPPGLPPRPPQVVMVYGQGAHRTAAALRSMHFAWPGLWPLDAEDASALSQGRWRRSCLDCGTPSHGED